MPGFGRDLNDADADAVRDYVIERANAAPAAGATAH
jgi:hypothetical protein